MSRALEASETMNEKSHSSVHMNIAHFCSSLFVHYSAQDLERNLQKFTLKNEARNIVVNRSNNDN